MYIYLTTHIRNLTEVCFNLSRNIDLHKISTSHTKEDAIAGRQTGLINLGEFVTWEAVHFGFRQRLSTRITAFQFPMHFRDEQIKGPFKVMKHDHYFAQAGSGTVMRDVFYFKSPFGMLGRLIDALILRRYLLRLLMKRNATITEFAENGKWKLLAF